MDEILSDLWIGSLEQASDEDTLRRHDIGAVLSIGCESDRFSDIEYCAFPEHLDMPETNLLNVFPSSTQFLVSQLALSRKVLVHCVYGQSRSASAIAAFLIIEKNMSLEEALDLLKDKHPSICINPGFLSQLHLLAGRAAYSPEYELLTSVAASSVRSSETDAEKHIRCKYCSYSLCLVSDVMLERENHEYMSKRTDPFWKDYKSVNLHKGIMPSSLVSESVMTRRLSVFSKQILDNAAHSKKAHKKRKRQDNDKVLLNCPRCSRECGYFRLNALLLCNSFLLGDLTALMLSSVTIEVAHDDVDNNDIESVDPDSSPVQGSDDERGTAIDGET